MLVARRGDDRTSSPTTAGSRRRAPVLAGLLTLFLLAQAGVPFTGGFVAKLVGVQRRDRRGPVLARADRHARRGDRRVRLPAHRARDVRAARRRGAAHADDRGPRRRRHAASRSRSPAASIVFLGVVPGIMLDFATPPPNSSRTDASWHAERQRDRRPAPEGGSGGAVASGGGAAAPRARSSVASLASSYAASMSSRAPEKSKRSRGRAGGGGSMMSMLGRPAPLELVALVARVHEARHHDVERRAHRVVADARRHVQHEDAVDRSRRARARAARC